VTQLVSAGEISIADTASADGGAGEEQAAKRPKKSQKSAAAEGDDGSHEEDVTALKAQLESLKSENKKLKKRQRDEAQAEKKKAKPEKKDRAAAASKAAAAETEAPLADVSAWEDFQLEKGIQGALARLGFSAPTHIQAECLPAAIRDGRDIIGAAQTVRSLHCC
jgi:ATP-dependent RNA helicase DDX24/MAK5